MKTRTLFLLIGCVVTAAIVLTSLLRYRNGVVVSLLSRQADAVSDLEKRLERNSDDAAAMVALIGVAEDRSMAMQARMFAVEVIGREGRRATPRISVQALAMLRRLTSDDSNQLRRSACQALGAMGAKAGEAVDDVIAAMVGGRGMDVEAACAAALGDIASMPEKAIPALANLVSTTEPGSGRPSLIRGEEVDALAKFGVTARRAVPKLEVALSDPDTEYRRKVVSAMVRIDPRNEKLPQAAASLLKSDDSVARYFGLKALGDLAGRPLDAQIKRRLAQATCDSSKENADLARSVFARVDPKGQAECR
jgi:HEAT repeat protein